MQFGNLYIYFISIIVQNPYDGCKSKRNLEVIIIYVNKYFAGVYLLVQYINVIFLSGTDMVHIQLNMTLHSEQ